MSVAMSDHYYAVLLQAVGWIEDHAGVDAPEYPGIEELSSVVSNIAKLRETELSPRSPPASAGDIVVHLLNPTSAGDPDGTPAGATGPSEPPNQGAV